MFRRKIQLGMTRWISAAAGIALAATLASLHVHAETLTQWILIGSESDGSMSFYAEQGSYARIIDNNTPALRMIVKTSSRSSQDEYQQLIFAESLCAKGSGTIDRYTLNGLINLGTVLAQRPQGNGRAKNGTRASYDDMAFEAMCQAYETSAPPRADREPTFNGTVSKPSFSDRLKAIFQ